MRGREGHGSHHRRAEIDKCRLNNAYRRDNSNKRRVFRQSRKEIYAVASCVEAVECGSEDKEGEEGGEVIDATLGRIKKLCYDI